MDIEANYNNINIECDICEKCQNCLCPWSRPRFEEVGDGHIVCKHCANEYHRQKRLIKILIDEMKLDENSHQDISDAHSLIN